MRTILITYGCLSCLFSAGYGEENQPTVSDIPSCGILEAGKQTEIAALEQAAEQGDVQAQCRLVVIYARGEKIPKDERKAFAWASRAAQSGNPEGMLLLANCYYQGTGISQDIVQTRKWLLKSAEKGHPEAQFNLGILSEQGEGMAKNLQQAAVWYRKAAEQGFPPAQNNLGLCYLHGKGVKKDARQGVMWIFKAARQGFHASLEILLNIPGEGNPAGQVALEDVKTILRHDIQQGKDAGKNEEMLQMIVKSESENKQKLSELASLEEAAKKGDAEAQYKLVYMYVGRNKQKAFSWASRAAHQGSPQGMAALGELYYRGIGTDRNLDKAKEWLAKGAEQGAPAAQYNLGFLYEQGEGLSLIHI